MHQYINEICEFRKENPAVKRFNLLTNDPILNEVKTSLDNLKNKVMDKYGHYLGVDFTVEISQGIGFFPNILHLCILPPKQKVSNGIYTAICFDKNGKGVVIGCAESVTNRKGLNVKQRKRSNVELSIDVDGARPTTKYNNVFENPKEFNYNLIDVLELESHICKSLELCMYNLGLGESINLVVDDFLATNTEVGIFEKFSLNDIEDTRHKIAIQINARRGQKKFRNQLLEHYKCKCAITGCDVNEILEAAHIFPYKGADTNNIQNGILLRADVHTLFDLGLISIDPESNTIALSKQIGDNVYYKEFGGRKIVLPDDTNQRPSKESLRYHFEEIFKK